METVKRAFPREPIHSSTLVLGAGAPIAGRTRDLSPGGAFIETPSPDMTVGSEVQLFIEGATSALRTPATVVRVDPGVGFGVRFDDQAETHEQVDGFLRRLRTSQQHA